MTFDGEHYQLPLPDGPGKPLKLTIAPISAHIPIYLAAVGPKNLELAGELADGWLAIFYAPRFAPEQLERVRSGRARAGKSSGGLRRRPQRPAGGRRRPARPAPITVRGYAALYLGGMGSREQNFYNALAVRMGFGESRGGGPGPLPEPAAPGRHGRCVRSTSSIRPRCSAIGIGSPTGSSCSPHPG